ncbi:hypothetical protein H0H92_014247 [Tricholoma furcatifolium]|nr:hypothetical protein H0H92_014247 [Tricholoma furcatifolium]
MFQVAAHPTAFDTPSYSNRRHAAPSAGQYDVQLPRKLDRPPFVPISRDAIFAAAPELVDVPSEYIRRSLSSRAQQMRDGTSALATSHMPKALPQSRLPPSLTVPIRAASSAYPTHVMAVNSSKAPSDTAMVFPIHALVISSQCAKLPVLPSPAQQSHPHTVHLPVLPLSVPSPAAFAVLHSYLYDHNLATVLKALIPAPSGFLQTLSHAAVRGALESGPTLHQLSAYLCTSASGNISTLRTYSVHAKELWQTMCALGIFDEQLWDTLDLAWDVILGAFNLAAQGN